VINQHSASAVAWVICGKDAGVDDDFHHRIRAMCQDHGIAFIDRESPMPDGRAVVAQLAIGWKWLIKDYENLIVFHDSLLPRYRGFAPLVNALIQGEPQIGVTAIQANGSYDRGAILGQLAHDVTYPARIADMITVTEGLYQELVLMVVGKLLAGERPAGVAQIEAQATYSLWRDEEDYLIDWTQSSQAIRRLIDAVGSPFKGAKTVWDNRALRILRAQEVDDVTIEGRQAHTGKLIFFAEGDPVIVCGTGLLRLTQICDDPSGQPVHLLFRTRLRS
jgi:methionyl-tRNA formyltransferase